MVKREFGNLERIKDNYPKYVISGDLPDFSRNGIRHFNIVHNYPKYVISGDLPDFSRNGIRHFNIVRFLLDK